VEAREEQVVDGCRAEQLRLQPEQLPVDDAGIRSSPIQQQVVVGIEDFEPVGSGETRAVVLVEDEAADSGIVESVLLEKRPIDEGLDDDVVLGIEMDDDAGGAAGLSGITQPSTRPPTSSSMLYIILGSGPRLAA
jgi:hypothetical protein